MASQENIDLFNEIYDETYKKVLLYIISKCGNTEDISDIIQETYAELYSALESHDMGYIKTPEAFVMQIAKSKVYKHYKLLEKFKNIIPIYNRSDDEDDFVDVNFNMDSEFINIEEKIVNKELLDRMYDYLLTKPNEVKKVFYMYYYLDLTIDDISNELHMSNSNVKNKLYRTVKELRKLLNERGE